MAHNVCVCVCVCVCVSVVSEQVLRSISYGLIATPHKRYHIHTKKHKQRCIWVLGVDVRGGAYVFCHRNLTVWCTSRTKKVFCIVSN
jgi:hypothetical protein